MNTDIFHRIDFLCSGLSSMPCCAGGGQDARPPFSPHPCDGDFFSVKTSDKRCVNLNLFVPFRQSFFSSIEEIQPRRA